MALIPSKSTLLGSFPATLTIPYGMTSHNGRLLIADADNIADTDTNELWEISDPDTPSGATLLGTFPAGMTGQFGMTSHNGRLLIADADDDDLWEVYDSVIRIQGSTDGALAGTTAGTVAVYDDPDPLDIQGSTDGALAGTTAGTVAVYVSVIRIQGSTDGALAGTTAGTVAVYDDPDPLDIQGSTDGALAGTTAGTVELHETSGEQIEEALADFRDLPQMDFRSVLEQIGTGRHRFGVDPSDQRLSPTSPNMMFSGDGNGDIQRLADFFDAIRVNFGLVMGAISAEGDASSRLREQVNDVTHDLNRGISAARLFPWAFGILYDRRNIASITSSSGGTWLIERMDGTIVGDIGSGTIDWDDVAALIFHPRDAYGVDVSRVFRNEVFATPGGVPIGIRRQQDDETVDIVGFQTAGDPAQRDSDNGWRVAVTRGVEAPDDGTVANILPPHTSNYEIRLVLPGLERDSFELAGRPRRSEHFWALVSAETATQLMAISDTDDWPAQAVIDANNATDGRNRQGDIVTLYRGDFRTSRAWDPVVEEWVAFTPFFGGNLVGINGVLADHIASDQILARHIVAGTITALQIAAGTITAAEIAANTITASKISSVNLSAVTGNFSSLAVTGRLEAGSITTDVQNYEMIYSSSSGTSITQADAGTLLTVSADVNDFDELQLIVSVHASFTRIGSLTIPVASIPSSFSAFNGQTNWSGSNRNEWFAAGLGSNSLDQFEFRLWRISSTTIRASMRDNDGGIYHIAGLKNPV